MDARGTPLGRTEARALTLAELLVVIGIVALLLGLLLPALGAARARSRAAACSIRLSELGKALAAYSGGHGYLLPLEYHSWPETNWIAAVFGDEHLSDDRADTPFRGAVCPNDPYDGRPPASYGGVRRSYLVNSYVPITAGIRKVGSNPYGVSPTKTVLIGEKYPTVVGWYLHDATVPEISNPTDLDKIDLHRHGNGLRSNHLFLDLHVSNGALTWAVSAKTPWFPRPE